MSGAAAAAADVVSRRRQSVKLVVVLSIRLPLSTSPDVVVVVPVMATHVESDVIRLELKRKENDNHKYFFMQSSLEHACRSVSLNSRLQSLYRQHHTQLLSRLRVAV